MKFAEQMFNFHRADDEFGTALEAAGVPDWSRLSGDAYDNSLEIYGVAPDIRLTDEAQKLISDSGFSKVYVNHTDKWETHYNFWNGKTHVSPVKGWRVSYPHKHGDGSGSILVEERVKNWPTEWFETGYVVVKPSAEVD